jgi:hypothetical protein
MFNGKVAERILFEQKIFPEIYTLYGSYRDCHTKLCGGGKLISVSEAVFGVKHRFDLEYFQEYV